MITLNQEKKRFLDYLFYEIGKQQYDFELCGTYGDKQFTKWKRYSEAIFPIDFDGTSKNWKEQNFFSQINQRQILPIEVVLDLEEKSQLKPTIKKLKKWNWNYYVFSTGSRGYHIHLFFEKEINPKEKLWIIQKSGADTQKAGKRCLISLEFAKHWKSGEIKEPYFLFAENEGCLK